MEGAKNRATGILLAGNIFLFLLKLVAGIVSNSLAVISDAFNSLTDIMGSVGVLISIKIGSKGPDEDHPFGHHRAEPIAGLIIAVLAGILGFEVINKAVMRLLTEPVEIRENVALLTMAVTIPVKLFMGAYFYFVGKKVKSPALKAAMVDAANDVLIGFVVIAGIWGVKAGYPHLDAVAGLGVGVVVIIAGIKVGKENIDFLMGKAASGEIIDKIREHALQIEGVIAINEIVTHYVGNVIQVEIHIEVESNMKTKDSHLVGKKVRETLETLECVSRAFVHIDPHC